jgi:hypothetical protein
VLFVLPPALRCCSLSAFFFFAFSSTPAGIGHQFFVASVSMQRNFVTTKVQMSAITLQIKNKAALLQNE